MKYKIVEKDSLRRLEEAVQIHLEEGWKPQGGLCFLSNGRSAQALTLDTTADDRLQQIINDATMESSEATTEVTTYDNTPEEYTCMNPGCDKPAVYVRYTQFAGTHYFCEECGPKEDDYACRDSYLFWEDLRNQKETQ